MTFAVRLPTSYTDHYLNTTNNNAYVIAFTYHTAGQPKSSQWILLWIGIVQYKPTEMIKLSEHHVLVTCRGAVDRNSELSLSQATVEALANKT